MSDDVERERPHVTPPERLDSWKEIAAYLGRDVTTVQRWEKRESMPVHRHLHQKMGSVHAFRSELDAWMRRRLVQPWPAAVTEESRPLPPRVGQRRWWRLGSAARIVLVLAVAVSASLLAFAIWVRTSDRFWMSPLADARFQRVTDFDAIEQGAVLSRDGRFVAFLSDRDGEMDVWVTQLGSNRFVNLTRGRASDILNTSVRTLGFSPDGSLVTFWARSRAGEIGTWSVPTLGGEVKPHLAGVAESDWSADATRLVYHTPDAGDPMFVTDARSPWPGRRVFTAAAGRHAHFPTWSPDGRFIYFVEGTPPDQLDVWRVSEAGGQAERMTSHGSRVTSPVFVDSRTLLYLASDAEGGGPWLYGLDVHKRVTRRLSSGLDRYTSLSASADGRRVVATVATPRRSLWRVALPGGGGQPAGGERVQTATSQAASPRLGPDFLLHVSSSDNGDSIWRMASGTPTELWSATGGRITGGPSVSPDGRWVVFAVRRQGRSTLYAMRADGSELRTLASDREWQGDVAWAPDGSSVAVVAVSEGVPQLLCVPLDGGAISTLVRDHAADPAWSPDGQFVVFSGPDVGTFFPVRAVTRTAASYPMPALRLTRGARHLRFLPQQRVLAVLRGTLAHKDVWFIDLDSGDERQVTRFPPDFHVVDFDIAPDGRSLVVERLQEQSDIALLDLKGR